jgi:prepilin-type N-terminal cleavage/methylation domain-containing protein
MNKNKKEGFTLIEVLIVIGIIAVLAGVTLVAINPARQFAQARNSQRVSNIYSILNAIGQRIVDNKGVFEEECAAGAIPMTETVLSSVGYDIASCLIPAYITSLPFDPSVTGSHFTSPLDYNTNYTIMRDESTGRITVAAPGAELGQEISVTR